MKINLSRKDLGAIFVALQRREVTLSNSYEDDYITHADYKRKMKHSKKLSEKIWKAFQKQLDKVPK